MTARSDEELVQCFLAERGSASSDAAVNELFGRYTTRVASWCYRATGNQDMAADLAQEVFLRTYRHMESFQGNAKFSTWLYVVARNHCLNSLKARALEPSERGAELSLEMPDLNFCHPAIGIEMEQARQQMRAMITETLDDTEVQVMTLHFGEELPLNVVTRVLGLKNSSGAKAYIVSAKRKLTVAVKRWNARARRQPISKGKDDELREGTGTY